MMWNHGYGMGWGWGMWLLMGLGMIAFWVAVIFVIRALLPGRNRNSDITAARPDPLTLLKETLARGEISPEDYEQRRRILVDGH